MDVIRRGGDVAAEIRLRRRPPATGCSGRTRRGGAGTL